MKPKQWLYTLGSFILLIAATIPAGAALTVRCTDNPDRSVTTCRIDQPVVTREAQLGRRYPEVTLRPGDLVTITAGGCVQTGGHGKTWKRYVNPSGPDSNRLYHGTVWIPGSSIPRGSTAQIRPWLNRPIPIPPGVVPPDNVLVLGYTDDDYSDNGYHDHDDGTEDQCRRNRDGGPAWVVVKIEHDKIPPIRVPAPFDIVADMVDANGLPLNPKWGWEANPASRKPPFSNGKQFATDPHPDAAQVCDGFRYVNPDDSGGGIRLGTPPCTTQIGPNDIDVPGGINDRLCKLFGPGPGILSGHVNWWPATITGVIRWAGHITGIQVDGNLHEHHGDDDYGFYLFPSNNSLMTLHRSDFIEAEMDSDETVDHFGSQWWNSFHAAVDSWSPEWDNANPLAPASQMINWKEAMITGLVNIDQEHGHSELHPIYALAIRLNKDANDDRWAIFARNWGNQGFCSQDQHYWNVSSVSIFIPEPVPASDYALLDQDLFANKSVTVQHGKVPGGIVIKFDLGAPENRAMVDGSLRIRWVPLTGAAGTMARPALMFGPSQPSARMMAVVPKREEGSFGLLKGLAPDKIAMAQQQLKKPPAVKNTFKIQALRVVLPPGMTPQAVARIAPPRMRAVRDTARAEKLRHQLQVLCAAHNNNIPGLPRACTDAVAPPRPVMPPRQ